jgi:hypothetical protein
VRVPIATIMLPRRFNGPPDSANGGYTAGALGQYVDGTAEVTLRRPPPLERTLVVERESERLVLRDGSELIAEATATTLDIDLVPPVDFDVATAASETSHFRDATTHPFATCFACGPAREPGDGLRLFSGRVPGTRHFAVPWIPADDDVLVTWAALDCPSSAVIALDDENAPPHVLGRLAARIDHRPEPGTPHVIMSWQLGRESRKVFSASAIYDPNKRLCAVASATWIRLAP